jgi:hypothetical protein
MLLLGVVKVCQCVSPPCLDKVITAASNEIVVLLQSPATRLS